MINQRQIFTQISIILLAFLILFILPDVRKFADEEIRNTALKIRGELQPDTNIILIHFSEEDIVRIGPWPIKRNYYALLINQLSKLDVKKIGLEIFLSSRFVTQSVYDNLLKKEIEKSGKVILSSVAGEITERNDQFYTDSLSFPSPKLLDESLYTGHINFLRNYDIEIPMILINKKIYEKAFAYQISGLQSDKEYMIVNFFSSWEEIPKYSALEFAELVYNQSPELSNFKNKIVLIGISDIQIAPTIQTPFDEQLPGIALHYFAIDNLLNSRSINDNYYLTSIIIFSLLVIGFIFLRNILNRQIIPVYLVTTVLVLLLVFILISLLNLKIASSISCF